MKPSSTNELINVNEAKIIRHMLRAAKKLGWSFEVYEGEDLAYTLGDNIEDAIKSLGSTRNDWIRFYNTDKVKIGVAYFIYGNGNDGLDCLTDHSCDEGVFEEFMQKVSDYAETLYN